MQSQSHVTFGKRQAAQLEMDTHSGDVPHEGVSANSPGLPPQECPHTVGISDLPAKLLPANVTF